MDPADLADLFRAFGAVDFRRMFGGTGLYADGVMFALAISGELYLKADNSFAAELETRGSAPFSYAVKGGRRRVVGSFWQVPEAALDDAEDLAALARRALEVARAAAEAKARRPAQRRAPSMRQSAGGKGGRVSKPG